MSLAVQNGWGGPESTEKRDWFAGAISSLIESTPDADVEYLEEFLLQVMSDEFDVFVEDDSGEEIAAKIVGLRKLTLRGDFALVDQMHQQWQQRQSRGLSSDLNIQHMVRGEDEDDTDWDSADMQEVDGSSDVNMEEAPALVKVPKQKYQPKIDDEGFTEVKSKRRR